MTKITLTTLVSTSNIVSDSAIRDAIDNTEDRATATKILKAAIKASNGKAEALRLAAAPFILRDIEDGTTAAKAAAAWGYGLKSDGTPSSNASTYGNRLAAIGTLILTHGLATTDPVVLRFAKSARNGGAAFKPERDYVTETPAADFDLDRLVGLMDTADAPKVKAETTEPETSEGEGETEGTSESTGSDVVTLEDILAMVANIPAIAAKHLSREDALLVATAMRVAVTNIERPAVAAA